LQQHTQLRVIEIHTNISQSVIETHFSLRSNTRIWYIFIYPYINCVHCLATSPEFSTGSGVERPLSNSNVSVYTYICVCVCVCTYIYKLYTGLYTSMYTYTHTHTHKHTGFIMDLVKGSATHACCACAHAHAVHCQ